MERTGLEFHLLIFAFYCCVPLIKTQQEAGRESCCASVSRSVSSTANSYWRKCIHIHKKKSVIY